MPSEPEEKRAFAFLDGQNLFYAAKEAFDYSYPNYDPMKLADAISQHQRVESRQDILLYGDSGYNGRP